MRVLSQSDVLDRRILARQLHTRLIGRTLFVRPEVHSTNSLARRLAREGYPDGTVLIAESQSGGRGKQGSFWFSPPGGLWLSVILKPRLQKSDLFWLTLMAAEAVAETIRTLSGFQAEIKWPNDVLLNGRKVCGILTEISGSEGHSPVAVVGIGLNLNLREEDFPDSIRSVATSLQRETGRCFSRTGAAVRVLSELDRRYQRVKQGDLTALRDKFGDWAEKARSGH